MYIAEVIKLICKNQCVNISFIRFLRVYMDNSINKLQYSEIVYSSKIYLLVISYWSEFILDDWLGNLICEQSFYFQEFVDGSSIILFPLLILKTWIFRIISLWSTDSFQNNVWLPWNSLQIKKMFEEWVSVFYINANTNAMSHRLYHCRK